MKGLKKPQELVIAGESWRAVVLLITAKDAFGRPSELKAVHDDESVDLEGGEEFMVVYALKRMLRKRPNN